MHMHTHIQVHVHVCVVGVDGCISLIYAGMCVCVLLLVQMDVHL